MKDIVITGRIVKRELYVLLACFIVGVLTNLGAIIFYHRPFTELFSQIGYVVVFSVILYFLLWIVRLVALLIKRIVK